MVVIDVDVDVDDDVLTEHDGVVVGYTVVDEEANTGGDAATWAEVLSNL